MATTRVRYIVSRDDPDLYEYLTREFSSDDSVDVVLDRRHCDADGEVLERRRADRDTALHGVGWMIVRERPSGGGEA